MYVTFICFYSTIMSILFEETKSALFIVLILVSQHK